MPPAPLLWHLNLFLQPLWTLVPRFFPQILSEKLLTLKLCSFCFGFFSEWKATLWCGINQRLFYDTGDPNVSLGFGSEDTVLKTPEAWKQLKWLNGESRSAPQSCPLLPFLLRSATVLEVCPLFCTCIHPIFLTEDWFFTTEFYPECVGNYLQFNETFTETRWWSKSDLMNLN